MAEEEPTAKRKKKKKRQWSEGVWWSLLLRRLRGEELSRLGTRWPRFGHRDMDSLQTSGFSELV